MEQEAKRNFLFSIMGDDPKAVSPGENELLGERAPCAMYPMRFVLPGG